MPTIVSGSGIDQDKIKPSLGWLAAGFCLLGIVSILLPSIATTAVTLLVAATMLFWGGLGVWMSLSLRRFPEWKFASAAFGAIAALGIVFLAIPKIGIEAMTLVLVATFLVEGVFSVLAGLRLSGHSSRWGWLIASGVASLILGFLVLLGWPETASWLLGLIFGVNFLTTGLALFALRHALVGTSQ